MSRRVLFLAHSYPPENLVGALRPFRFAKYLPRFGYTPIVITASAQPSAAENVYRVPDRFSLCEKILNRILIFEESFSWGHRAARAAEDLMRREPVDLVFSTSPPFGVHIAARRLKHRLRIPWIADFRDPMKGNDARLRWPIRTVDRVYEPGFFRDADLLIANTEAAARFLKSRCPEHASKIRYIYNGFDPETPGLSARPIPPRPRRLLLHAGSLYRVSMTLPFLEALSAAIDRHSIGISLRMVGEIDGLRELRATPAFQKLESAGVLECVAVHIPAPDVRSEMAEADFLVAIDRYREGGIIQLPAKTFEYIQVGRPILAVTGPDSPMEYALRTSGVAHTCLYPEKDSPGEMARKLAAFFDLPTDPVAVGARYTREFGAEGQAETLAGLFDELLKVSKASPARSPS
jgi:glycosyltransferase involved in cell wall biosynthesis